MSARTLTSECRCRRRSPADSGKDRPGTHLPSILTPIPGRRSGNRTGARLSKREKTKNQAKPPNPPSMEEPPRYPRVALSPRGPATYKKARPVLQRKQTTGAHHIRAAPLQSSNRATAYVPHAREHSPEREPTGGRPTSLPSPATTKPTEAVTPPGMDRAPAGGRALPAGSRPPNHPPAAGRRTIRPSPAITLRLTRPPKNQRSAPPPRPPPNLKLPPTRVSDTTTPNHQGAPPSRGRRPPSPPTRSTRRSQRPSTPPSRASSVSTAAARPPPRRQHPPDRAPLAAFTTSSSAPSQAGDWAGSTRRVVTPIHRLAPCRRTAGGGIDPSPARTPPTRRGACRSATPPPPLPSPPGPYLARHGGPDNPARLDPPSIPPLLASGWRRPAPRQSEPTCTRIRRSPTPTTHGPAAAITPTP